MGRGGQGEGCWGWVRGGWQWRGLAQGASCVTSPSEEPSATLWNKVTNTGNTFSGPDVSSQPCPMYMNGTVWKYTKSDLPGTGQPQDNESHVMCIRYSAWVITRCFNRITSSSGEHKGFSNSNQRPRLKKRERRDVNNTTAAVNKTQKFLEK